MYDLIIRDQMETRRLVLLRSSLATILLFLIFAGGAAWSSEHRHGDENAHASTALALENSNHPAIVLATKLADAIANEDVNTLRSVLAPDVLIFESGGVESSLEEYEGNHMPADMAFMKNMNREVVFQRLIDSGDSAIVVTHSRVDGMFKGRVINLNTTETLVMRKVNGQFSVIHIHWSSRQ